MLELARKAAQPRNFATGEVIGNQPEQPVLKRRRVEDENRQAETSQNTAGGFEGRRTRSQTGRTDSRSQSQASQVIASDDVQVIYDSHDEESTPGKFNTRLVHP